MISLVASACTGLLLAVGVAVAGTSGFRSQLETQLQKSGNADVLGSVDDLVIVAQVLAVLAALWCLSACALAVFAFLGHGWSRIMLAVSAIVAGLLSLLAVISFPGFLAHPRRDRRRGAAAPWRLGSLVCRRARPVATPAAGAPAFRLLVSGRVESESLRARR